ncbi:MAG: biopolymer transporter ExbD [Spirochaetales bacterium]|nr:biopolymer transporter ExbD [Spirochaetales bacterium]
MLNLNKYRREDDESMNLMPLIDVIFILLVFFMITARFQNSAIPLNLPRANSGVQEEKPAILTVNENKTMDLDGIPVNEEGLEAALMNLVAGRDEVQLSLACDRDLPFGFVVFLLDTAKIAGIENIGIRYESDNP